MPQPYTIEHYENFPVASILLPHRLRHPISVIYTFARQADDFADEGDISDEKRLLLLDEFRQELDLIKSKATPRTQLFLDMADIIDKFKLPLQPFYDLLSAFSQDVIKSRYADFGELIQYCRRSANPIGQLLLHLYGEATPKNLAYSDAICTSLQLINFWQDIAIDFKKDRIYLPLDEMAKFQISENQIAQGNTNELWGSLMLFQLDRTRKLLQAGAPLGKVLRGRIGLEMRMIIMGGETILRKLHKSKGDVFRNRPVLKPIDWLYMSYRAIRAK
ncbi:squalene synthase HpnC [Sulfurirhabdus autotrophica]|uniref:Squalene synthase HpnC n=1 Tax=Sulfurirhabdus autotrophica TaxID=1706046 RepID=A0A4R3Y6B9_9PROT|nr:squalene synthase HpnC [Sulfurirhabdus autotrophica]TCV87366.1 squalene synthase HpnC [Sulfurirhabdus autotrophica]